MGLISENKTKNKLKFTLKTKQQLNNSSKNHVPNLYYKILLSLMFRMTKMNTIAYKIYS